MSEKREEEERARAEGGRSRRKEEISANSFLRGQRDITHMSSSNCAGRSRQKVAQDCEKVGSTVPTADTIASSFP